MTGRRKRQQWPPELKAEALRIAQAEGANIASDRTGITAGTIRSWVARAGGSEGERNPEAEAADLEAKPPEALSVNDWIHLQRLVEGRFRRSLASGSPSDARWHSISLGVVTDKLKAAREMDRVERPPIDSPDRTRAAAILDSIVARTVGQLAFADVDRLRVEVEKERRELGKHRRRLKMLLDEMLIRRKGGRSQFTGVTETNLPEPWDHFDLATVLKVNTVIQPPARPSPYVRYSPARDLDPGTAFPVTAQDYVVPDRDEPAEEVAGVTPIARARRRSSWGRSVQQEILRQQGIDEPLFRPPGTS